jgi:hypothetical protein
MNNEAKGTHQIQFEKGGRENGIYIVELTVDGEKVMKRVVMQ